VLWLPPRLLLFMQRCCQLLLLNGLQLLQPCNLLLLLLGC
jgi:hypothetical protein